MLQEVFSFLQRRDRDRPSQSPRGPPEHVNGLCGFDVGAQPHPALIHTRLHPGKVSIEDHPIQ
jgi:hypothetical protein